MTLEPQPESTDPAVASTPDRRRHAGSASPRGAHPTAARPNSPGSPPDAERSTQSRWIQAQRRAASVLIVDDHAVFRSRARALLEAAGYDVVGEAADAVGAIAATQRLDPDVVLLDVQLPDRDGFSVAAEIGARSDAPAIVLISSREAADYGDRLGRARARGFIHKPDLSRATLEALVGAPAERRSERPR